LLIEISILLMGLPNHAGIQSGQPQNKYNRLHRSIEDRQGQDVQHRMDDDARAPSRAIVSCMAKKNLAVYP
jgi:hypothetical protein